MVLNTSKRVTEKQKDLLNGVVNSKMHESGKQLVTTVLMSSAQYRNRTKMGTAGDVQCRIATFREFIFI